jgi:hypothetical protein
MAACGASSSSAIVATNEQRLPDCAGRLRWLNDGNPTFAIGRRRASGWRLSGLTGFDGPCPTAAVCVGGQDWLSWAGAEARWSKNMITKTSLFVRP